MDDGVQIEDSAISNLEESEPSVSKAPEQYVQRRKRKPGRPRKSLSARQYREKWKQEFGDWLMQSTDGTPYCKVCKMDLCMKKSSLAQHERTSKHRNNVHYVSMVLSHLDIEEQSQLCDFVYLSLLGESVYRKWKNMKRLLGFAKERDFILFLLNTAQEKIDEEDNVKDGGAGRAQKVRVRISTEAGSGDEQMGGGVMETEVSMGGDAGVLAEGLDEDGEDGGGAHMDGVIPGNITANRQKLFACKYCKKIFLHKDQVTRHIQATHVRGDGSGLQRNPRAMAAAGAAGRSVRDRYKYKCSVCFKEFKYKAAASKHMEECKKLANVSDGFIHCVNEDGEMVSESEVQQEFHMENRAKKPRRKSPTSTAAAGVTPAGTIPSTSMGETVIVVTQEDGSTIFSAHPNASNMHTET